MKNLKKINITRYNKTQSHCSNCDRMDDAFNSWAAQAEVEIDMLTLSAEDHRDELIELGATSAPVYVVHLDGDMKVISGYNPDILIDTLNGESDIWEESDCAL